MSCVQLLRLWRTCSLFRCRSPPVTCTRRAFLKHLPSTSTFVVEVEGRWSQIPVRCLRRRIFYTNTLQMYCSMVYVPRKTLFYSVLCCSDRMYIVLCSLCLSVVWFIICYIICIVHNVVCFVCCTVCICCIL